MRAVDLKLLRELWQLKMQMLSIALVVATGIMSVMTMRGTYDSLVMAQQNYYAQSRFADLWAPLVRAPQHLMSRIESIAGIELADSRVRAMARLDIEGLDMPAQGLFVSVPELGRPLLNDIVMQQGRYIVSGAPDEVIISENFARARDLRPGDRIRVIINGRSRELDIVGVANSPEHSYAVPPGALFPEDERYGVFWMGRQALGPAFDMDGAFNEIVVRLTPDSNPLAVMRELDELLRPYGGLGSYLRADQLSHQILESELQQNRVTGTVIPAVFLAVAVFLLHLVLGRLITTQRGEIAVLKAFGYSNIAVGLHFLSFALVAVLLGSLLGLVGGYFLGGAMMELYAQYFGIPDLQYRLTPSLLLLAVGVSLLGACTGALSAVRRAVRLPPAEAMQPEAPARFSPGPLEKAGFGRLLSSSSRMILRNLERKPLQACFSALGVSLSLAILVIGMFMYDSIAYMMDLQFRQVQREDVSLNFQENVPDSVRFDLLRLEGVTRVETYRSAPARLRAGHRQEDVGVQSLATDSQLRRIVNADGRILPVPAEGVILSSLLAQKLQVSRGDVLNVEWLDGQRRTADTVVAGIVDDLLGLSVYMSKETMARLSGESNLVSGAWLLVDGHSRAALYARLGQIPAVAGVSSPQTMLAAFESELAETMWISVGFLLGFACIIAVGVIYNGARISLSERGRELASLRVMGFHRREVAILLLGEQALITLLAVPLGCLLGYGLARLIAEGFETDTFRVPFVFNWETYIVATIIVILAALASGLAVRRRLDSFDLVEVLKTRE